MKELIKIESNKCFSKRYSEIENTCNLSKEEIVLPRDSKELFMEVQIFGFCLKACSFIKKRLQHRCFPVTTYFKKHLRPAAFLPFNGSQLLGPKVSKSNLYDGVRLQGLAFCF